jgi:undecaprenyl-diphosphatase
LTLLQALLLGTLQGLTEFLPISSSGHLALVQSAIPGLSMPLLLFDVVVHLGTLTAIVLGLRRRVLALLRGAVSLLPGVSGQSALRTERRWILLIAVSAVPTAIVGLALKGPTEAMLHHPPSVGAALLLTAYVLVRSERRGQHMRGDGELRVPDALLVGLAQGLAVIPGISRSGVTIGSALWRDVRGEVAVEFSLLVSIPGILGATLLVVIENAGHISAGYVGPLVVGFLSALLSGLFALRVLQWAVARRKLLPFAGYCGLLGVGAIVFG